MMRVDVRIIILAMMVLLAGCQGTEREPSTAEPAHATTNRATDAWLGQWNGPEGTFLVLSKDGNKYVIKIQSLDGPNTYEGVSAGDRIEVQRNGKTESIRAGNGEATGMKWLLDKTDCLIVKTGEGFCRK